MLLLPSWLWHVPGKENQRYPLVTLWRLLPGLSEWMREQVYLMEVLTFRSPSLFSVLNFTALTVPKMFSAKLGTRSWSWNPSSRSCFVLYHDNSLNSLKWRINTCHYLLTLRWFVFYIQWLVEDVISIFLPEGQWKKCVEHLNFFVSRVCKECVSEWVITHLDSVTQIWSQIIFLDLDAWLHQSDWKISLCMYTYMCVCVCVCLCVYKIFNSVLSFACKLMSLITVNKKYSWSYFSRRGFLTVSCSVNCWSLSHICEEKVHCLCFLLT